MALSDTINAEIKAAMLAKDQAKLAALRAVKSALLLAQTESSNKEVSEAEEMKILQKLVKQRNDAAAIYREQNREDLAKDEEQQAEVIASFLPKQMSEDEIKQAVEKIIADTGASSMADMGKVMGIASKQLAGKADGKVISTIVKSLLG